jgi:hypothetical protein
VGNYLGDKMSKLEVKEIGPISGETDLTLGQSGGTVTLADGATAVGFGGAEGSVIQFKYFESAELFSATTGSNLGYPHYAKYPGFELSITPKDANSKMLLFLSGLITHTASNSTVSNILREGVDVEDKWLHNPHDLGQSTGRCPTLEAYNGLSITAIDSPNTAQEVTYSLIATTLNSGSTGYVNYNPAWSGFAYPHSSTRLLVMEVAG